MAKMLCCLAGLLFLAAVTVSERRQRKDDIECGYLKQNYKLGEHFQLGCNDCFCHTDAQVWCNPMCNIPECRSFCHKEETPPALSTAAPIPTPATTPTTTTTSTPPPITTTGARPRCVMVESPDTRVAITFHSNMSGKDFEDCKQQCLANEKCWATQFRFNSFCIMRDSLDNTLSVYPEMTAAIKTCSEPCESSSGNGVIYSGSLSPQ